MISNRIISVLIGLVGACNSNPKAQNTDAVIIKALALSAECSEGSEKEIVGEIIAEKNVIAPNCAYCATPCGNTSNYDMDRIYGADESIRDAKLSILAEVQKLSADLYHHGTQKLSDETVTVIYKALSYISYDIDEKSLTIMLEEVKETNKKYKENELCCGE